MAAMIATDDPINAAIGMQQPVARPTLRCRPERVSGTPVCLDIFPFIPEMPVARFQENEKPCFLPIAISSFLHRTSRVRLRRLLASIVWNRLLGFFLICSCMYYSLFKHISDEVQCSYFAIGYGRIRRSVAKNSEVDIWTRRSVHDI